MGEFLKFRGNDPKRLEDIQQIIQGTITAESIFKVLTRLQSPAPSGTVPYTRNPEIRQMVDESGIPEELTMWNFGTETFCVMLDRGASKVLFDAHSDGISYIPPDTTTTSFEIKAYCAHRLEKNKQFAALVLRWDFKEGKYKEVAQGAISTLDNGLPYFTLTSQMPEGGFSSNLDRVVFKYELNWDKDTQIIKADLDNAAGVAALILALDALAKIAKELGLELRDFGLGFVFPDEEEGLPGESGFFARGARRLMNQMARVRPNQNLDFAVVVDGHDRKEEHPNLPETAAYASYVSNGKGAVLPPHVNGQVEQFFEMMKDKFGLEIEKTETEGVLSRSNDVAYVEWIQRVLPVGYWINDPHFNTEHPTSNIISIVNCAQAIVHMALSNIAK